MASEREIFDLRGPRHLSSIDWWDSNHGRCIAASLVQGVYVLERDRQERRIESQALAEKWWNFFKFKVTQILVDKIDGSIFGAVYKWTKKTADVQCRPPSAPEILIAFRGTVTGPNTFVRDPKLDADLIRNGLHPTCRYELGLDAVRRSVCKYGRDRVWIAGHSLGARRWNAVGKEDGVGGLLSGSSSVQSSIRFGSHGDNQGQEIETGAARSREFNSRWAGSDA